VGSFTEFDFAERPLGKIFNNNAADYEAISYGCCGVSYRRDRTGTETEYFQDELKRVWKTIETTGAVVVTTRTSRVAETGFEGMVTETRRSATGLDHLVGKTWETTNGEIDRVESPDEDGDSDAEATTYAYSYGTGHSVTVTNPDGSTEVSDYYVDGRPKKVSGTAAADTAYDYYVHSSSSAKGVVTKTTRLTSGGGTGEWTESYNDLAGRLISIVYPSTLNAPPANDSQTYSYYSHTATAGSRGKRATSADPDGVTVGYEYDAEGHLCETTETMPNSAGSRVTEHIHSAVTDGSLGACTSEVTKVNGVTVSTVLAKGTGYAKRTTSLGRVTLVERTVASGGDWTETTTRPDGTRTVDVYADGRLSSVENRDSASGSGNLVSSTGYGYDSLGRLSTQTDSRTGAVTFNSRTESGNLLQETDAGSRVTLHAYDAMGRKTLVNAKNGTADNITRTSYHADGSVKAVWGDLTYPTFHLYDEQGRMVELRTYRSLAHGTEPVAGTTGGDVTTGTHDSGRGWLTQKRDAANKGANYAYTGAGRLRTRTWARGAHTRYDYSQGMLAGVNYFTAAGSDTGSNAGNDTATADLGYTYDAMGRLTTVTREGSTHFTYTYSSTDLGLLTEIQNDAFLNPRLLTRKRDSILRPTGYLFGTSADPDLVSEVTHAYDTSGRLSTVTFQRIPGAGSPPAAQTFTYGYNYTSGGGYHVATSSGGSPSFIPFCLTGPSHTAKRTYEATRGSLRELANESLGSDLRSRYTYAVNPLGQREEVEITGSAYGTGTDFVTWTYDAKGQMTSANSTRGTSSTAHDRYFEYDQIGNRIESRTETHVASGGSITAYFGNTGATVEGGSALNQYTAIVTPSDSLEPVHDDDGNLTSDGQTWNYAWDGENRMISATPVAPTSGLRRMTYRYDYLGRLASRGYASWNAGTSIWSDFENVRYVYDGWNRIDSINWDTSIRSQYVWGLDLSGTFQGAGGVGGMLLWANSLDYDSTYAVRYPAYDGNGNVTELLDGTGAVAEHWEYDAFGNTVASTNSFAWNDPAQLFEFRFSTKPQDLQTGLYYYGYRFYDPVTGRWPSRDPIGDVAFFNPVSKLMTGLRFEDYVSELHKMCYGFLENGPISVIDKLGLRSTGYGMGGKCCNKSDSVEWALVDGYYLMLEPGECTKWCDDCDGMTCRGGFFPTPTGAWSTMLRLTCKKTDRARANINHMDGWTPDNGRGASPFDRGLPASENVTPPGYEWTTE
jgi:RHS repeat-associated protein